MKKYILLFIGFIIFTSCQNNIEETFKVRVAAVSDNTEYITFNVYPENSQGNIVSGAVVTITDESNAVHLLPFSSGNQVYTETIEGTNSSVYTVQVSSNCISQPRIIKILHTVLTEKPALTVFNDSDGNSALAGNELQSNKEIQLAWKSLGENVVYNVSIKSTLKTVFSKSTEIPLVIIPANTLKENSNYTVYITAQKIYGDPVFLKDDFYSASSITSSGISFFTK